MRALSLFLIALPAAAQIAPPRIGCFIDAQQRLRSVYGTAGNFIVSAPEREGALAALCAAGLTIIKTENAIEVNGTVLAAPPGPAWIAPDGLVCYANGECERFGAPGPAPRVEGRILQCQPEGRKIIAHGASRGNAAKNESAPEGAEEGPGESCSSAGPVVLVCRSGVPQCEPEGPAPPRQPEGRKIIAHGASRGNAAKNESAPEGAEEQPRRFCSCGALPVLIAGNRCIALPAETERVHYLGPGWLRIVLAGGGHMALSLERMALYLLPEVMP